MSIWDEATRFAGGHELAWILVELVSEGRMQDLDEIAAALERAWTLARQPMLVLDRSVWIDIFELTGYLVGGVRDESARPHEPFTVYRAATSADANGPGLSWTDRLEVAEFFVEHNRRYDLDCSIMQATVWPGQLLTRFDDREEGDYVADVPEWDVTWI